MMLVQKKIIAIQRLRFNPIETPLPNDLQLNPLTFVRPFFTPQDWRLELNIAIQKLPIAISRLHPQATSDSLTGLARPQASINYPHRLDRLLYPLSDIELDVEDYFYEVEFALSVAISHMHSDDRQRIEGRLSNCKSDSERCNALISHIPKSSDSDGIIGDLMWLYRACQELDIQLQLVVGPDQIVLPIDVATIQIPKSELSDTAMNIARSIGLIQHVGDSDNLDLHINTTTLHDLSAEILAIEGQQSEIKGLDVVVKVIEAEFQKKPLVILTVNEDLSFGVVNIDQLLETQKHLLENASARVINQGLSGAIYPFLERQQSISSFLNHYYKESDPDEQNAMLETFVNDHVNTKVMALSDVDRYLTTTRLINRLVTVSDPIGQKKMLYDTVYSRSFDEDRKHATLLAQQLLIPISDRKDRNLLDLPFLQGTVATYVQPESAPEIDSEAELSTLCGNLQTINPGSTDIFNTMQGVIEAIHEKIKDIQSRRSYVNCADDADSKTPIHLLAELCLDIQICLGLRPRNTQLMAVLALLNSGKNHLVEVKTGEGKTLIVAMLAIVNAKRGLQVDIITSAKLLAERDYQKFKPLYDRLGIESGCNCTEDQQKAPGKKTCYEHRGPKIVYGDSQTFQADKINNDFYEKNTFASRPSEVAIVDEADNALIDKANWVCQISDSIGGMSTVTSILDTILDLLTTEAEKFKKELDQQIYKSVDAINNKIKDIEGGILRTMKERLENKNFLEAEVLVPHHLHPLVENKLEYWVKSAVIALMYYQEDKQYVASDIEKKIIPIDYLNTGEWENNLQYSDGLHYFLNKLNGFETEPESLTKTFLSNITFFKGYIPNQNAPTKKLYGLSGTLGGDAEWKLFETQYQCGVTRIPRFADAKVSWLSDYIAENDEKWQNCIYQDILHDGHEDRSENPLPRQRATLVIFKTIDDVKKLEQYIKQQDQNLEQAKRLGPHVVTFIKGKEDQSSVKDAESGKIILATNLAGRGTDIDAKAIEQFGGLHVIIGFLPVNQRVEEQAVGRTGRQGLSGSVRRIIKRSELPSDYFNTLNFNENNPLTSERINEWRDAQSKGAIEGLNITFQHAGEMAHLFEAFQTFFHGLKDIVAIDNAYTTVKVDLHSVYKEYVLDKWAFYFDSLTKQNPACSGEELMSSFNNFKLMLYGTLSGVIGSSDLYRIQYANILLNVTDTNRSRTLDEAVTIYKDIGAKNGICSGFALYNQAAVLISKSTNCHEEAKSLLNDAMTKFKANPYYEKIIAHNANKSDPKEKLSPPLYRLLAAMVSSCKTCIEKIDSLKSDKYGLYAEFLNPFEMIETTGSPNTDSDPNNQDIVNIPESMIGEAIKFGLKGPLNITSGPEAKNRAMMMFFVCLAVVAATIALMVITAGATTEFTAMALNFALGTVLSASIDGAIYSFQGAVNNQFSFTDFGINMGVGAVSGFVTAGVGAGFAKLAGTALAGTSRAVQVAAHVGVGAVGGAAARGTGYLVSRGLSSKPVQWDEFGRACLHGAIGGAMSGGMTKWVNAQKIHTHALTGSGATTLSNLASQGIEIAMGDRRTIDANAILQSAFTTLISGAISTAANQKADKARVIAETQRKLGGNTSVQTDKLQAKNLLVSDKTLSNGMTLSFEVEAGHMVPKIGEERVNLKPIDGYCVEQTVVYQQARKIGLNDHFAKRLAENKSFVSLTRGILNATVVPERFEGGIFGGKNGKEESSSGQTFDNLGSALHAAKLDSRAYGKPIGKRENMDMDIGNKQEGKETGFVNRTELYRTSSATPEAPVVAIQYHPGGHLNNGDKEQPRHVHVRKIEKLLDQNEFTQYTNKDSRASHIKFDTPLLINEKWYVGALVNDNKNYDKPAVPGIKEKDTLVQAHYYY